MVISPNPFSNSATISFVATQSGDITLEVYNVLGELSDVLLQRKVVSGEEIQTEFNSSELPDGIYYLVLRLGDIISTNTLVIQK